MMKFRGVIFDLDGTLADTIGDIAASMNRALETLGYPAIPPGAYKNLVGWGIKVLAQKALPPGAGDEASAGILAAAALRFYEEQPLVYTKPYPGIPGMVAELKGRNIKTAVLTNKPDSVARMVIARLFPPGAFTLIRGESPGLPRKPDPAALWDILPDLDLSPRDLIFAGDSEVDMETALAAGCHALGVSWGFRGREALIKAGAQRVIDTPAELLRLIDTVRL
jgi:phosphoglycolate phosphatase